MILNTDIVKNFILTLQGEIDDVSYLDDLWGIIERERDNLHKDRTIDKRSRAIVVYEEYMVMIKYMITYLKSSTSGCRLVLDDMLFYFADEDFFTPDIKRKLNRLWYEENTLTEEVEKNTFELVDMMKTDYNLARDNRDIIDALINLSKRQSVNNMMKSFDILKKALPNLNIAVESNSRGKEVQELYSHDVDGIKKAITVNKNKGLVLPFGVRGFDEVLIVNKVAPSEILVVLAPSGGGKSRTLYELADIQATSDMVYAEINNQREKLVGKRPAVLYFTFENTPIQVYKRLVGKYGISENLFDEMDVDTQVELIETILEQRYGERVSMVIMYNKSGELSAKGVADLIKAREAEKRLHFVHIFMDYADLIVMDSKHTLNRFNNATPDIVNKVMDIKENIAVELKRPVTTAAQLTTEASSIYAKAKTAGAMSIPTRAISRINIAGGRDLVQKADYVVIVNTDNVGDKYYTEFVLEKERSTRAFKKYDVKSAQKLLKGKRDNTKLLDKLNEHAKGISNNDMTKIFNKFRDTDSNRYAVVIPFEEQSLSTNVILESRLSLSENRTLIQASMDIVGRRKAEEVKSSENVNETEYGFE